jgi:putative membrane protein
MRRIRSMRTFFCAAALVCLAPACKSSDSTSKDKTSTASTTPPAPTTPSTATPAAPTAPPAAPAKSGLDDAQIAAIVVAANQVDIDAGNLAASTSKNPDVVSFAKLMVTDHTAVNDAAVKLVTRLGVTPRESDVSRSLVSGGDANRASLAALTGDAFDRAYVDHEVTYHQQVIDAVDSALIPSASNAELKQTLVSVRPALVTHLEHAKHLQAALAGGAAHASAH